MKGLFNVRHITDKMFNMNITRLNLFMALLIVMCLPMYAQLEKPAPIRNEILIKHDSYILSFNREKLTPNYVAWCLTPNRVNGPHKRSDFFDVDPKLPGKYRVTHSDYSRSRLDRGHMCPAADNRHSKIAMSECFYMSNMCPQSHGLNVGAWNDLEIQCRSWANNYKKIYIASGPIYDSPRPRWIGKNGRRIAVPDRFFKVVLMMGRVPKAIGFIYPNQNVGGDMRDYAVSVNKIEKITGFDFFQQLDDRIENKVEDECNPAAWGI